MTFAHFPGETEEQTAGAVEALETELASLKQRIKAGAPDKDRAAAVEAELARVAGQRRGKQTRAQAGDE